MSAAIETVVQLHLAGKVDEAERGYRRLIAEGHEAAIVYGNLGAICLNAGRADEAVGLLKTALKRDPTSCDVYRNLALAFRTQGRVDETAAAAFGAVERNLSGNAVLIEALGHFDWALAHKPGDVRLLAHRGNILWRLRRFDAALRDFDQAMTLKPGSAELHNRRATALRDAGRLEDALTDYARAVALDPHVADAYTNRAAALFALGRPDEAFASYAEAIRCDPDNVIAHWNEGLLRLRRGEFDIGWRKFEWRWRHREYTRHDPMIGAFPQPRWTGEDVTGKTVLLQTEQGFGDSIQFCRYAKLVAARGARVVLQTPAPLVTLFRTLEGVDEIITRGQPLPDFDVYCTLPSLPFVFQTRLDTIPADIPYLHADRAQIERWTVALGAKTKPRVGLSWSGAASNANDRNRSLPLATLLTAVPKGLQRIVLQKDIRDEDAACLRADATIIDPSNRPDDFSETAALIAHMDVIVTVDTSVAHLAGALGKPAWVVLARGSDWRWMEHRSDSPWYPTVRLFRQPATDDWPSVMAAVKAELEMLRFS